MRSLLFLLCVSAFGQAPDWRNIRTGLVIPDEWYADQPYVVKARDGAWVCVITTGPGAEGAGGQHVVSLRSTDQGKTWEAPVPIEPGNGPEASYVVPLLAPSGRIYVFYNHNTDNIREVIADKNAYPDGKNRRVDSLGHFVFKYSDDNGHSWSAKRYEIPQRDFAIDRQNPYQGSLKFFWTVGKAFLHRNAAYVPLHKVGGFGEGFFTSSEGVLLRSPNLPTERDPERIRWETLPEGEIGIRTPAGGGPIAEEQSFVELSDGSLFCVFRTIDGYSAHTYSRDGGRTWEPSQYMQFANGRRMKHPRAANFVWKTQAGRYLYWFHNHGGRFIAEHPRRRTIAYEDRNPAWVSGGLEADGPTGKILRWSEPEILLYDDDPIIRMSYPDFFEDNGKFYLTETQKDIARLHTVDAKLLDGLWNQGTTAAIPAGSGPVSGLKPFAVRSRRADHGMEDLRSGFSVDFWVDPGAARPGQILISNRTEDGRGFALRVVERGAVELTLSDGRSENRWRTDTGALTGNAAVHIAVIVDGGPKVIVFVVNGIVNDGGEERQFGWGRFSPNLLTVAGRPDLESAPAVHTLRFYPRALRISEAIGAFRAGPTATPPR